MTQSGHGYSATIEDRQVIAVLSTINRAANPTLLKSLHLPSVPRKNLLREFTQSTRRISAARLKLTVIYGRSILRSDC